MHPLITLILLTSWTLCVTGLKCWTCENAKSQEECLQTGRTEQCRTHQSMSCQTEVRHHEGWGGSPLIRTGCKERLACHNNQNQNPSQCTVGGMNSVCRCCCQSYNCNKRNLLCKPKRPLTTTGLSRTTTEMPQPRTKATPTSSFTRADTEITTTGPSCAQLPKEPSHGMMECTQGKKVGSACLFVCQDGYMLSGPEMITCVSNGKVLKWDAEAPQCKEWKSPLTTTKLPTTSAGNTSPPTGATPTPFSTKADTEKTTAGPSCAQLPKEPSHGMMECTQGKKVGSACLFICQGGYMLSGPEMITCVSSGKVLKWDEEAPQCKELPVVPICDDLGKLDHGEIVCTLTNNHIGTVCGFQCLDDGYKLENGYVEIECNNADGVAIWSDKKPRCKKQTKEAEDIEMCPRDIVKDVVIVMDSSRSINRAEWDVMKEFVSKVIGKFEVSKEAVQFSVFRFNGRVDLKSQILFEDYANDADGLSQAVKKLPKYGGGTRLGKALKHARDHVLTQNNRKDVDDLILVLTDGKTKDLPLLGEVSLDLRNEGVEILALGVSNSGEEQFADQLVAMTGSREHVLEVEDVIHDFSDHLVCRVASKICV